MRDNLDLQIDRVLAAPRGDVWRCWTEPALLMDWYCPKPWRVTEAVIELHPGGRFDSVFEGPEGERSPNSGVILLVDPGRRLVFTDAMTADFVPAGEPFMVGHVTLSDEGGGTRMIWGARHWTAETAKRHLDMGFEPGWNAAADQLEALAAGLGAGR